MVEANEGQQSLVANLKQESLDTAKSLAPWRAGLPWWVVLVEGIVLVIVGLLILIDPRRSTVNIALFLSAAMLVAGILQLWAVLRGKTPESIDGLVAARGSVGVFAGAMILLLAFLDYLTLETGLLVFGLGSLIYGVTGFAVAYKDRDARRRTSVIEGIFFGLFGGLLLYILIAGEEAGEAIQNVTRIIAWVSIAGGAVLVGLSFYNRYKEQQLISRPDEVEGAEAESGETDTRLQQPKADDEAQKDESGSVDRADGADNASNKSSLSE